MLISRLLVAQQPNNKDGAMQCWIHYSKYYDKTIVFDVEMTGTGYDWTESEK